MSQVMHYDVGTLRAQVVLIFVLCLIIVGALWTFVLHPLQDEIAACGDEVLNVEEELAAFLIRMEDGGLSERLTAATARNRQLVDEWKHLRERVDTFHDHKDIRESLPTYEDGRIDFKVALFEAREELLEDAAVAGVELPEDLGVSETIGTEERAEVRLWHLAATMLLIRRAIDAKLPRVTRIESGRPAALVIDSATAEMAIEFPTRIVARCSFSDLVRFLDLLSQEGRFYAVRKLRVERLDTHGARMLEAEIVAGAFLFLERNGMVEPIQNGREDAPGARRPRAERGRRTRLAQQRREARYDG